MTLPEVTLTDPRALRGYAHPVRMALMGLLRREGPMTATQAAEHLDESVPSCSFHLRQLAKYGLAERVPGADARERPWQATALMTSWDNASADPDTQAALIHLNTVILDHYLARAREFLSEHPNEPPAWREHTGFSDSLVYLTAAELARLTQRMDALVAEFDGRLTNPATRPDGSRGISLIRMMMPVPPPRSKSTPRQPTPSADPPADPPTEPPAGPPTGNAR